MNTRTGEFVVVGAKAVILATGPCGRLGLPASGYLYGTYENPTNAGDGYSMAYHAGAELSGIECFQINPLIKDYNGPACAYVANPFGGYQVNAHGERFVDSDYWSGQMMAEVKNEIESARGPIYLKVSHLPDETLSTLEGILHTTERPTRGTFHANRGHDYRTHDIEMHISEIGLCSGHSASGVWVDEHARTTVPGLYAAGDLACVPHNYMIGAFVYGDLAGAHAASTCVDVPAPQCAPGRPDRAAHELIYRPLRHPDGPPQPQVEYKLRRFVNDYVAPPKTAAKLSIAVQTFERMRDEIAGMGASTPHELMRAVEVSFIRDCAEMAARSSLTRTESRWGLYHDRADLPSATTTSGATTSTCARPPTATWSSSSGPSRRTSCRCPDSTNCPAAKPNPSPCTSRRSSAGRPPHPRCPGCAMAPRRTPPSPRIAAVLALDEPTIERASAVPDRRRPRRAAHRGRRAHRAPAATGTRPRCWRRWATTHVEVRRVAADGIRELVEVLPDPGAVRPLLGSDDPVVRGAAVYVLSSRRAGDAEQFRRALADQDHRVRIEAVRALVSVDDADGVAAARNDANREVRIAVANGLGTLAHGCRSGARADRRPRPAGARRRAGGAGLDRLGRRRRDVRRERACGVGAGRSGRARPAHWPGAVADGRRATAVARAVRSAPRRAQGRGAEPDPVGVVGGGGPRGARPARSTTATPTCGPTPGRHSRSFQGL